MKKHFAIAAAAAIIGIGGTEPAWAGFGDAVAGGIVGGVVGSVITNEIYHSGRRHHRTHRRHRAPRPVMTDEKRIQIALQNLGYYRGPIDGAINSFATRTAIKEFNRAYNIGDAAYMSPQERDALIYLGNLFEIDKNLNSQGNDRRSRTRRIQAALKILGFYTGKIDGSNGPMTRRAISGYRQANGLGAGYRLGYEDEYRLLTTAKQSNDRNIQETLNSLKRLGAANQTQPMGRQPMPPASRQPVILQPAAPAPMPAPAPQTVPAPMPPAPVAQPMQAAPAPMAPQPVQQPMPVQQPAPTPVQQQAVPVPPQPATAAPQPAAAAPIPPAPTDKKTVIPQPGAN